jgi:hypothetical protein
MMLATYDQIGLVFIGVFALCLASMFYLMLRRT